MRKKKEYIYNAYGIPRQLTVPPMPKKMTYNQEDVAHSDITIDLLINMLNAIKEHVGGQELIVFRESSTNEEWIPTYPIITFETSFDPLDGKKMYHRVLMEISKNKK